MKLTLEKLQSECPNYREATSLNLDCKRLNKLTELGKCRNLQYISLRFNQILSIDELSNCPRLWIVDLLQNQVSDVSCLKCFQALGSISLSCNNLTVKSLEPLQNIHIISFEFNNPKTTRADILNTLPQVWILNGVYVTLHEKRTLNVREMAMRKLICLHNGPAGEFVQRFQGGLDEFKKFEYLIYDLERVCELEWEVKNQNKRIKASKFPKFQLCRWMDIKPASKLVLSCVLFLYLEGFYPCSLVKEIVAIVITESYPENTPLVEAVELCELPCHYLLSFIIFLKSKCDGNSLWKRVNIDYLIRNFFNIQKRFADQKSCLVLSINEENPQERGKILENRQHMALFVLTVFIKFEIVNQILANKQKNGATMEVLENLLEYARVDEETLLSNLPEFSRTNTQKEVQNSIINYSRSLQNLQISENNSSRYGAYLVKTKGSSKNLHQDEFLLNRFNELNNMKKAFHVGRGQAVDKFTQDGKAFKDSLPPVVPTVVYTNKTDESIKESYHRMDSKTFSNSEVWLAENSDKTEFLVASAGFLKRRKNWKSLAHPPAVYSLTSSSSNIQTISSQKHLHSLTPQSKKIIEQEKPSYQFLPTYYFEEVLKVTIEPSENPGKLINFTIEFPTERAFLTRIEHIEYEKPKIAVDTPTSKSCARFKLISKDAGNQKKWYPVPKRVRFIVDDNFVQNLKPCNFYEEHKDLLPPIPEKVYKKSEFMLLGKQPEITNVNKEIVKNQDHMIRVISRENTPWVRYELKPKNKVKQDAFCANYGELLTKVCMI